VHGLANHLGASRAGSRGSGFVCSDGREIHHGLDPSSGRATMAAAMAIRSGPRDELSTADVVHAAMREAEEPLTFEQLLERVMARSIVNSRNPRAAVRGALSQGKQLIPLGDGRYGYLPRLLAGSLVRLPLVHNKPPSEPLVFPDDVRHVLFPDFYELHKRKLNRAAQLRLPTGNTAALVLEHLGEDDWGVRVLPHQVQSYLLEQKASAGDDLLIRVLDAQAGLYEAWLDPEAGRDEVALAHRNHELADAAYRYLDSKRQSDQPIWDILDSLLARGAYRSEVAARPLQDVLRADRRFVEVAPDGWTLASRQTTRFGPAVAGFEVLVRRASHAQRAAEIRRRRPGSLRIYQIKVTLSGIRPSIWRRILVRSDTPLDVLHQILQTVMGWFDEHLHAFEIDGLEIGAPDVDVDGDVADESSFCLSQVASAAGARLVYRYDFGDDWEHQLVVEKVLEPAEGARHPRCVAGKRATPPEDIGGPLGYQRFLEIISDATHPERAQHLAWAGGEFDPDEFEVDAINEALALLQARPA
jgi:hypothetical protein